MSPESEALAAQPTPMFTSRRRATRLLLLHHEERRLLALLDALGDEGYRVQGAASAEEARRLIDRRGVPDALLTPAGIGVPMPGMVFARECLARFADLRVLYLTGLPWAARLPLVARERLLRLPFTAEDLALQLRSLDRTTHPARLMPAQLLAG